MILLLGIIHVVIHELGHILAALAVGSRIKAVGVNWRGPYVRRAPASSPIRNVIVALSGPFANLLTCLLMIALNIPHAWIAFFIGWVNLLPLPCSDLSNALKYIRQETQSVAYISRKTN